MSPAIALFGLVLAVVLIGLLVIVLISCWKLYVKMGVPGWKGIVPFYSGIVMLRLLNKPVWLFWVTLLMVVPMVPYIWMASGMVTTQVIPEGLPVWLWVFNISWMVMLVISILVNHALSERFGHDIGFAIGLTLLPAIFLAILAFGDDGFAPPEEKTAPERLDI